MSFFVEVIQNLVCEGIPILRFFRMGQKPSGLIHHQNVIILVNDAEVTLCHRNGLFLHKSCHGFFRQIQLEGIPLQQHLAALCLAFVELDAFFPQHFIDKAFGRFVEVFQQIFIQSLVFLIFGDLDFFQFSQTPLRNPPQLVFSCGSKPDMH